MFGYGVVILGTHDDRLYVERSKSGGARTRDEIASDTSGQADLMRLIAIEALGSLPGLPQTSTLCARRYRAFSCA
jgi:hypothetical protein